MLWLKKDKRRIFILGLDGVSWTLVKKFCADGTFRFVEQLEKNGVLLQMEVPFPEISAVSWSSFMTGKNPAEHGIFGFTDFKENSYEIFYPNFNDLKVKTFWEVLGEREKQCVVLNQPMTYPAKPISGILVSGFVAIELSKAVQPLRYLGPLRRMNYQIDIETHRCRSDHNQMFLELEQTLNQRKEAVKFFFDEIDWDLFEVVKTGTDRLQHYLFDAIEDSAHKRHLQTLSYYQKIDEFIRFCWEKFFKGKSADLEGENFYMLSDHGFCRIKREVYVNAWLRKNGYLEFEKEPPEEIKDIKKTSKAFCLDPSRIYLHRRERFPQGCLTSAQAENLRNELKNKLLQLEFDGEKVLRAVYFPEEIYSGKELHRAPDLILVSKPGFDLKGNISKLEIFGNSDLTGTHTFDDAFFWAKEYKAEKVKITDLAEIFLEKLS